MKLKLDQLARSRKPFDVIVIGGGIQGAGIAREARLRGLSVALFEKNDFASGTSGKTSGLIHGGLRYLEHGDFRLVREALHERYRLLKMASHLVAPLSFLFPIYKGGPRRKLTIRIGMLLYDLLAGKESLGKHWFLSPEQVLRAEPGLASEGLLGAARFSDCQMDDARLCLATLSSAQTRGAEIFNYTEVVGLMKDKGKLCGVTVKEAASGKQYDIEGRVIINATGVWSESVCQMAAAEGARPLRGTMDDGVGSMEDPDLQSAAPSPQRGFGRIRPTKGIHLVLPKLTQKYALVLESQKKGRLFFVLPWRGQSLVGTTDTDYQGDLDHVVSDKEDIETLLQETAHFLPQVTGEKILARFAALRPLVDQGKGPPWEQSRKEAIVWTPEGMLVVLGGKFTLFRKIAIHVLDRVIKMHPRLRTIRRPDPEPLLHGGPICPLDQYIKQEVSYKDNSVSIETLSYLIRAYGTNYKAVLACAKGDVRLLKPLTQEGYPLLAEVIYAVRNEYALHLSDFMLRRTRLAHGCHRDNPSLIQAVAETMGAELMWSPEEIQRQCESYHAELAE